MLNVTFGWLCIVIFSAWWIAWICMPKEFICLDLWIFFLFTMPNCMISDICIWRRWSTIYLGKDRRTSRSIRSWEFWPYWLDKVCMIHFVLLNYYQAWQVNFFVYQSFVLCWCRFEGIIVDSLEANISRYDLVTIFAKSSTIKVSFGIW